jgi:hypothetical protein
MLSKADVGSGPSNGQEMTRGEHGADLPKTAHLDQMPSQQR